MATGTEDATAIALGELDHCEQSSCRVHAVAFEDAEDTLHAAKRLRADGFDIVDVHSPFPIHGIEDALGWRDTNLPWATFAGGCLGVAVGLALTMYVHTVSWPLNIGGKTNSAIPGIIPVVFELGVLLAAFGTVFALLFRRRLWPRRRPELGPGQPELRVTDDRFVILVAERDARFSSARFHALLAELEPVEVTEAWRVY